jgi:predicted dinucleotide-binding enzyme
MRIAIIGTGNLGGALGRQWAAAGHAITYGSRDPGTDEVKGGLPAGARLTTVAEAAQDADAIVLAVPAMAVASVVTPLGAALDGRIVIDATNAVGPGIVAVRVADGISHGEQLQALLPKARVIKAFNQVGANVVDARDLPARGVQFVAGNDAEARGVALTLTRDAGFDALDAGSITRARELEHFAILWISLSANPGVGLGRDFAFHIVKR